MLSTAWKNAFATWTILAGVAVCAAQASEPNRPCAVGADVGLWTSPRAPVVGRPLRLLAVATNGPVSGLAVTDPAGRSVSVAIEHLGGPPWSVGATLPDPQPGSYRVEARHGATVVACATVAVGDARTAPPPDGDAPAALAWDARTEAFYSAWIERLFDAPPAEPLGFPALQDALRDHGRNFLHDHLHLGEDDAGSRTALPATPDCADLPYVLRAYFAWKVGLPVDMRTCSRGAERRAPRCGPPDIAPRPGAGPNELASFNGYARQLADTVHSGSARTALTDDATDFYPVALARDVLRPGVIYADPYGHTLMIVKWVAQTPTHGGMLLAVDAQPDNSIGRKRFWEGTFLFTNDPRSPGAGFKAFRPIVAQADGRLGPLPNAALTDDPRFLPFSDAMADLPAEAFYAQMSALINPRGLDPVRAYEDTLDALVEQVQTRIGSVDTGEHYVRANPNPPISMPEGKAIFETIGPWEDYSTPARDMRLLIAMNVLARLPESIVRHPDLYVLGRERPDGARARLQALHARRVRERTIVYTRSDGSPWTLTVADLLARKAAFEMAYNPNDCVEIRWGAREGTPEYAPCRRHAPAEQRARMAEYRAWFRDTRRPTR